MPSTVLTDHSPHNPSQSTLLQTASNLILIDNYDSFTWNVYQYLVLQGATVTVFRNDQVTLTEIIERNPTQIVISPGPGHPRSDAGISNELIRYFAGKIPILGVCLGQQCIISVFGGLVDVTGEILHGKTSQLQHDGQGVYKGLSQGLLVTRYHSLAGTRTTVPDCLEISSWTTINSEQDKGVIMGVRHKEFVIEGVQFHPESILTEHGRHMLKNFLFMRGGHWTSQTSVPANNPVPNGTPSTAASSERSSILDMIYARRRQAVEFQANVPSLRWCDLQAAYDLNLSPPQISFPERLRQSPFRLSLMAEIKRASPSKGIILLDACAPILAREYASAGASVISVLTEPDWFKGSIEDLRAVRQSLEAMPSRPAVLRKEFIFDNYQILEARLAGADTVLLIVKMLPVDQLRQLYQYAQSLGMEPLVEVNTQDEMRTAIELGAQVIGVNNRNLSSFEVDLETTSRLMDGIPETTIVCALSGISGSQDVSAYERQGVKAVLVGEALMRAADTAQFVRDLLHGSQASLTTSKREVAVKICGTRTEEAARVAIEAGADLIGIILVPGRRRYVRPEVAIQISETVRSTSRPSSNRASALGKGSSWKGFFEHSTDWLFQQDRALLVGVFSNAPLSHVIEQVKDLKLDLVQLHGNEPLEWARLLPVPVIRRFHPGEAGFGLRGYHVLPLLDSEAGGSGTTLDTAAVEKMLLADSGVHCILAGGLTPDSTAATLKAFGDRRNQVAAVDVSSGIETNGEHDHDKIRAFIRAAKQG